MTNIALVGEAWGENEARIKRPFVGASGIELLRMLHDAKIIVLTEEDRHVLKTFWQEGNPWAVNKVWERYDVYRTNVFNLRPKGNKIEDVCGGKRTAIGGYPALVKAKHVRAEFEPELDRLGEEIARIDPNHIIALGNTAMWALCGKTAISKLRGTTQLSTHTISGFKVLPTYHPASIFQGPEAWANRPIIVIDLMKAKRESAYPEIRRPKRTIFIPETMEDLNALDLGRHSRLAVDIETSGKQITCIGFAPGRGSAVVIPFTDRRRVGGSYWTDSVCELHAWDIVKGICEDARIKKTFQNGLYDIAFLWRSARIKVLGAEEDTMLLHHALQPESLKGLGFLGSIYTDEGNWKQMRTKHETIKRDD